MVDKLLALAKRLHNDLFAHNLIPPYAADWMKTPEGITGVLQEFVNDKYWKKRRVGSMEFERKPNSIVVRIFVSQRRVILKTAGKEE